MKKNNKFGVNTGGSFKFGLQLTRYKQIRKNLRILYKFTLNLPYGDRKLELKKINNLTERYMCDGNLDSLCALEDRRFAWWMTTHWQLYDAIEVAYSINKHGRWKISDLVKKTIDNLQDYDDGKMTPEPKAEGVDDVVAEGIRQNQKPKFRVILVERKAASFGTRKYKRTNNINLDDVPYQSDVYGYHDSSLGAKHIYPKQKASYISDLRMKAVAADKKSVEKQKGDGLAPKKKKKKNIHWGRGHIQRPVAQEKNNNNANPDDR